MAKLTFGFNTRLTSAEDSFASDLFTEGEGFTEGRQVVKRKQRQAEEAHLRLLKQRAAALRVPGLAGVRTLDDFLLVWGRFVKQRADMAASTRGLRAPRA